VLGILAVSIFHLDQYGVSVVGEIPTGLPTPGLPHVGLSALPYLATGAVGIVFLAVGESLGTARAFAARHGYEIDPDQELIALGAANLSSGFFRGFTVDVSLSQSATADQAGARTQLASIITAVLIVITLLVLAPLFRNLPNAVLGAIVIASVIGLMDVAEMKRFWASNRIVFVLALVAMFGVLTTDVLTGLMIAVFLSLFIILFQASRPYLAVLGKVPGQPATYGDVARYPENERVPGLLIVRLDAPLYFLNANVARGQILDLVRTSDPPPNAVLFDLAASADLDVASLDMLRNLVREVEEAGSDVLLAQVRGGVRDRLRKSGIMAEIGEKRVCRSVAAAVHDFERREGRLET
jgi:sulfate permease, SulP family